MSDPSPPPVAPVPWVIKRDGRQVPFEADKISRSLFAASEELGEGDAFLCRELTDGILHFMGQEFGGQTPTTNAIADLVVKVVRELGQPALAQQYLLDTARFSNQPREHSKPWGRKQVEWLTRKVSQRLAAPHTNPQASMEDYLAGHFGLSQVFTADLVAVHTDGLIDLGSLRSCRRLTAAVLPFQPEPLELIDSMSQYRLATGDALILDSPERRLWAAGAREPANLVPWRRALRLGLGNEGCRAILNLHRQADVGEFSQAFEGPLFRPPSASLNKEELLKCCLSLWDELSELPPGAVRIDWHLADADFADENKAALHSVAERAAQRHSVCFVFDRPRRPVRLAEGVLTGQHAALLSVGLHLPQLARQMGNPRTPERFLVKLVSLVRLALSAATQKRNLLRRLKEDHQILAKGFFLEKARLVVVPIGLDAVVADLTGESCCSKSAAPLAFACEILDKIRTTLHEDGRALLLDAVIDSPLVEDQFESTGHELDQTKELEHLAGVTLWDDQAPLVRQIGVCGSLHEAARGGTALIRVNAEAQQSTDDLVQALRYAWNKTKVLALRFVGGSQQLGLKGVQKAEGE